MKVRLFLRSKSILCVTGNLAARTSKIRLYVNSKLLVFHNRISLWEEVRGFNILSRSVYKGVLLGFLNLSSLLSESVFRIYKRFARGLFNYEYLTLPVNKWPTISVVEHQFFHLCKWLILVGALFTRTSRCCRSRDEWFIWTHRISFFLES